MKLMMDRSFYLTYYLVIALISVGIPLILLLLRPFGRQFSVWLQQLLQTRLRIGITIAAITAGLGYFVVYFGNEQFGGFDQSIMTDLGWRLANGQKPYLDFACTMPPGFALGAKYAFLIWGRFWHAQLYMTALFTGVTFLWFCFLFNRIFHSLALAIFTAFCLECITNLSLSYWWYNTTASIAGGLFLASAFLYLWRPKAVEYQASYCLSLFLLAMMKPNTAMPLILAAVVILVSAPGNRIRTVLLSGVTLAALYGFLVANSFPVGLLWLSYKAGGESRTLGKSILLQLYLNRRGMLQVGGIFTVALLGPFLYYKNSIVHFFRTKDYFSARVFLLLCLGPVVGLLAMLTNGELKFVDMVLPMVSGVVLFFHRPDFALSHKQPKPFIQRNYIILFAILAAIGLYSGVTRFRVGLVGPFFQEPADHRTESPFFADLRTGEGFAEILKEEKSVMDSNPRGPIFFGPRMEFSYAAFNIRSPKFLPIWWDPGAAFPLSQESKYIASWEQHRFGTLIFYKNDFMYYSPALAALLDRMYDRDDSLKYLTIMRIK